MTTTTLTPADVRLREAALQHLGWDSLVDSSSIGVTARDGVVTLTGFIDSYAGKLAAERAVKHARGVRAVANDVQVTLKLRRPDPEIAADVAHALQVHLSLPDTLQAVVHGGHVTLTGTVHTMYDRAVAAKALRYIKGIKGIFNHITVTPKVSLPDVDVQPKIVTALRQHADLDARGIEVLVSGSRVMLTGTVRSWQERESAERAVMHAPGITDVDNRIAVLWSD